MNNNKRIKQFRWSQIHHTWMFWVFLILTFFAIIYYVVSVDFAFAPQTEILQPSKNKSPY